MRTVANVALVLSALLVGDAFAAPALRRDLYTVVDTVVVTEEVTVNQADDGSLNSATTVYSTSTIVGAPVVAASSSSVVEPAPTSTPSSTEAAPTSTEAAPVSSSSAAILIQQPSTTAVKAATTEESATPTSVASSTSSSAPAASATVSSNTGSKRGAAYNDASLLSAFNGDSKVSWAYNWGSSTSNIPSDMNYVPMLWGLSGDNTNGWNDAANKAIASGSTHLLAFNEPDYSGQSNLSPQDAATGYMTYMQPFQSKAKLGAPAVTNGGSPMGLSWLSSFISACSQCQIDFVPFHWYNGGDAQAFKDYVAKAYAAGGNRPLWITEFQGSGSTDEQNSFLQEVIPFLDSSDMVERYAYFGVFEGTLLNNNVLNTLGETFATFV